ncbi:MAG TPA: amidase family protein, partial [Steroidobacteraceae bacterium]
QRPVEKTLDRLHEPIQNLRIGVLEGWFRRGATAESLAAVDTVATALRVDKQVTLVEAEIARAAAFCITAAEGANVHLDNLRQRPADFDPATRDRLLAGALIPSAVVIQAQRFRRWFLEQTLQVFQSVDVLIAPCTPCPAPLLGETTMSLDGTEVAIRPNIGIYTQPLSFIGLPVVVVPIPRPGAMPLGVQIVAAPWQELKVLQVAAGLEAQGVAAAPVAQRKVH